MKYFLLSVLMILSLIPLGLKAQTVVFNEDFEGSTINLSSTSTGTNAWGISSDLYVSGAKSDSCTVTVGDTTTLTSNAFSTLANTFVTLEFDQICKIEFFDAATIEVSANNGTTWTQLTGAYYLGSGQFGTIGNKFNVGSYLIWDITNANATPTNTWWQHEVFDISSLTSNAAQVKVRFVLADGTPANGSAGNRGWFIDNVKVTTALSELQPPSIVYNTPILEDSIYNLGPFSIQASITDLSGVDTAMLIYQRNSGAWDTIGMSSGGNTFTGTIDTIPNFVIGDTVRYFIKAVDASLSHNVALEPAIGSKQFVIYPAALPPGCSSPITTFPFLDNFESNTNIASPSCGTVYPVSGWTNVTTANNGWAPHSGTTSSFSTGPTGDHTSGSGIYLYTETSCSSGSYVAEIESPCLDISVLSAPQLEFWYHMYGAAMGTLEVIIWHGNQWVTAWSLSGDQGGLWQKATVNLIPFKGITKIRIKGTRGSSYTSDMAIDDIKIWVPPANDAGVIAMNYPITPALSGTLPVHASVKNFGSANLTSVDVNWQVNGVNQTTLSWSGSLPPMTTLDSLFLGNYTFTAGAPTMKFWTSNPNGSADGFTDNDTLLTSVVVCDGYLHGVYTVGGATSDFADIASAVSALNNCGIDSSVVFNIANGTYTGQMSIGMVNGVSDSSTITFQSASGNPADVTIEYTSTASTDNYVILLDGANYVSIKNVTVKNLGATYSYAIHLTNGASHNNIEGNIIQSGSVNNYNARGIVLYLGGANEYNSIIGNDVSNVYYGIYNRGNTAPLAKGNRIENNNIHDFYYYGLYSYYQDSTSIIGNYIHDGANVNYYGIYTYRNSNGTRIMNNKIEFAPTNYAIGMYLYYLNNGQSTAYPCIVANNMVSITSGTGTIYGIYAYNSEYSDIVYNSINVTAGSNTSRSFYQSSGTSSLTIKNNSFVNTGIGYAAYINTPAGISSFNYNNIYTTGTKYAYWSGDVANMAALQLSSADNANSISADPIYTSSTDLHAGSASLYNAATPISGITVDYDGDTRDATTPCIGADEFVLVVDDAGISSLISPVATCPGDTANVIVNLMNYGLDTLFTCTIDWEVNSVSQSSFAYSDTLLPAQSANIALGTYVFSAGISYNIKFWTSSPNGVTDLQTSNDSLVIPDFKTAFPSGTYLVGSSAAADYSSIDSVIADLNANGICGPVTFNIESGTYTSRIELENIVGVNSFNTITFQSLSGDSTDVIINYSASAASASAIYLKDISYVTIQGITFNVSGTSAKGTEILGFSTYNTIKSCVFNMDASTSSSIYGLYLYTSTVEHNTFINNKIVNGYYAAYVRGSSTTSLSKGNKIIGNIFNDFGYYGIYSYYQDSIVISDNIIKSLGGSSYPRAIYAYYSDNAQFTANNILLQGQNYAYGMYMYYCDGSYSNPSLIANNMINIKGGTGTNYGIYFGNNTYTNLVNNTILINGGSSTSRGLYVSSGTNNVAKNNIFVSTIGYSAYYSSTTSFFVVDYNDYYTNGANFVYFSGNKANLTALQTASGKDAHSISVDPLFLSADNLHILTGPINGAGTPLPYVLTDIDGEVRDTLNPDMGADEFSPAAQDISIYSIETPNSFCAASMEDVIAKFVNSGLDTITGNLNFKYSLDSGLTWITESYNSIIVPNDTIEFTFSTQVDLSSTQDTVFHILIKGDLLNDPLVFNDTMSLNIFNGMLPASPSVTSGTAVYSSFTTLTASASSTIFWYANETDILPLGVGNSYTTGILFDTTVYYCGAQGSNGCISNRVPDTAYVTGIPSGDVGIASITVNEGCNIDSAETISIDIYNQGYGTVSGNLTAMFKVDNGVYTTPENVTTSIGSHDTITYIFTNTANLYAYWGDTTFSISAKVILAGDPYATNDTLTKYPVEISYTPADPIVSSPINIGYGYSPTLTAISSDSIFWYENVTDTIETGTGSTFVWPQVLYQTDTFYAQAGGKGSLDSLETTFAGGNGSSGNMFDITAYSTITLDSFNINGSTSGVMEVWYRVGSYVGFNTSNAGWTLASSYSVTTAGTGNPTRLPVGGITIPAGQTYGIYITYVTGSIAYTNGNGTNQIYQDNNLKFEGGVGGGYFSATFNPRIWNGKIFYSVGSGGAGSCASNFVPLVVNVAPPPLVDAAIDTIISPFDTENSSTPVPITVAVKNYGTNNITSVDIVYELDNVVIDTFSWTGSLAFNAVSAPITIYTDNFAPGAHSMRVWVQNANGNMTAGVNLNDTLSKQFTACLSGVYTLGGATSDFPTFGDALTALNAAGVCGDVTFNIQPGTYNTQIALQPVAGAGPNARITFQSATGDSTDVIIQATPAAANTNYIVIFFGGSYYTLKNLTIKSLGTYAHTVVYYNNSSNNIVENCIVESTVATSSNAVAFYDFSTSISSYNIIRNNIIRNGYYGIYLNGPTTYTQKGFVVEDNIISDFYYYGIYSYYQDSVSFNYNTITNSANSIAYPRAMYIYRNNGPSKIIGNKINITASTYGYGIYFYYGTAIPTARSLIANNAISIDGGTSTSYGLYNYHSDNVDIYHNSINMVNTYTSSRAIYQYYGSGAKIVNNIFAGGQGYAYYVGTPSSIIQSDYNDIYGEGTNLAYYSGNRASLSALQTASGADSHSVSDDPFFFAPNNLHAASIAINNTGNAASSVVSLDMDKEVRSTTTPDIGADEFTPPPDDAGIVAINSPVNPVNIGSSDVHVTIRNFGADTLTSANIAWSVNNVPQTSSSWTGSLISGATDDSLYIGAYSFGAGVNSLKVWSENPNLGVDGNNLNDTTQITLIGCVSPMHGTYTIGGASADFSNIADAVSQLNSCGVDSNVIFNITPGTYNTQIVLGEIVGAADTATITFQSSTLDSTDVTITYNANTSNNYIVYLQGSDWIRFKNLKIENQFSPGRVVVLESNATNNVFEGNILTTPASTSTTSSIVYSYGDVNSNNTFRYNSILNGYYGIYYYGLSTSHSDANVFEYNNIDGFYYYGTYFYYMSNLIFDHNTIRNGSSSNYCYGGRFYRVYEDSYISNNIVDLSPNTYGYGLYLYYLTGNSTSHSYVYNNFVGVVTSGSSTSYGIYGYSNTYSEYSNNNIYVSSSSSNSRCLYVYSGSNNNVLNNNMFMDGPGYAYYTRATYINQSDHNNIYTNGSGFAYWGGAVPDLATLQLTSGKDANSISVDPGYMSSHDLHVTTVNLNANATPLSWVTTDIDGEIRNSTTPDIGADEFTPQQWDAAVVMFHSPSNYYASVGTLTPVTIVFKNYGMDTILTAPLSYVYGNSIPVTEVWNGSLLPGDTVSYTFNTSITTVAGNLTMASYISLVGDANHSNDTLYINYGGVPIIVPTYVDNFDTPPAKWINSNTEWEYGAPAGINITSAYSAPNVWMTSLNGNYSDNVTSDLLSPFIDFSNVTGATLKFWYNSDLMSNDGVTLYYSDDGGIYWNKLGSVGDPLATNWYNTTVGGNEYWSGQSNGWMQATYNLSQFNNSVTPIQFKMHFFSDASGSADGFAFDNFAIQLPPIPNDAGVVSIDVPATSTIVGSMGNTVTVTVKNFGTSALTSIPVHYTINGAGVVNESLTVAGGLQPNNTASFTFTTTFQGPINDYTLCAFTSQAGDTYTFNDSACSNIVASTPPFDAEAAFVSVSPVWHDTTKMTLNTVVTLRIKNVGTSSISGIPVQFLFGSSPIANETYSGSIAPGDSVDYSFTTIYHSPNGNYLLCGKVLLPNDANNSNDQTCVALFGINDVGVDNANAEVFSVEQNQPNPAFGEVIISYFVPKAGKVRFELLNVLGQSVKYEEYNVSAGKQTLQLDANKLADGIYYYTVEYDNQRITHKMVVNK